MFRSIAFAVSFLVFAVLPAAAATPAQKAAAKALVAAEKSRGNGDVEQPSCYILQVWAQCNFGTGGGNAEVNAWMHFKNSKWVFLGEDGGVTYASMMEKRYGIPAAIAKQFQAKICPSPCPGS